MQVFVDTHSVPKVGPRPHEFDFLRLSLCWPTGSKTASQPGRDTDVLSFWKASCAVVSVVGGWFAAAGNSNRKNNMEDAMGVNR